jgi:MFS family permease
LLFIGSLLTGFSFLLLGPAEFLDIPQAIYWPIISLAIMQIGNILIFIPILPEIVDCLTVVYPDLLEDYIGDIGSALYNGFYALGAIIGPLISGFLVKGLGF